MKSFEFDVYEKIHLDSFLKSFTKRLPDNFVEEDDFRSEVACLWYNQPSWYIFLFFSLLFYLFGILYCSLTSLWRVSVPLRVPLFPHLSRATALKNGSQKEKKNSVYRAQWKSEIENWKLIFNIDHRTTPERHVSSPQNYRPDMRDETRRNMEWQKNLPSYIRYKIL